MRIVILTQYYPPEIGAPQNRLFDLARRFVQWGHEVQVLTAMPSYPGNKVFPEYAGQSVLTESRDGVTVTRLALCVPRRKTFWKRIVHYCSFALHAAVRGPRFLDRGDFLITESPPLFLAPVGHYLARRLGAICVLNVADLWPASAVQLGMLKPGLAEKAGVVLEEWSYRRAELIFGQSNGIVRDIKERFPEKPVYLYPNGADMDLWRKLPDRSDLRRDWGWPQDEFIVGHVGLHGHLQALEQVLGAAQRLRKERRIRVVFFGDGPTKESLQARAKDLSLPNVHFYPPVPHKTVPGIFAALDAGLVTLAAGRVFEGIRPAKLFEIMAAGLPVVMAGSGEPAKLVEEAEAGVTVLPESPVDLSRAIVRLSLDPGECKKMGQRGRGYVMEHFDREKIAKSVENVLLSHLPGRRLV
jgi:glycosyltransferase involved in cell wall biosynthesis